MIGAVAQQDGGGGSRPWQLCGRVLEELCVLARMNELCRDVGVLHIESTLPNPADETLFR